MIEARRRATPTTEQVTKTLQSVVGGEVLVSYLHGDGRSRWCGVARRGDIVLSIVLNHYGDLLYASVWKRERPRATKAEDVRFIDSETYHDLAQALADFRGRAA